MKNLYTKILSNYEKIWRGSKIRQFVTGFILVGTGIILGYALTAALKKKCYGLQKEQKECESLDSIKKTLESRSQLSAAYLQDTKLGQCAKIFQKYDVQLGWIFSEQVSALSPEEQKSVNHSYKDRNVYQYSKNYGKITATYQLEKKHLFDLNENICGKLANFSYMCGSNLNKDILKFLIKNILLESDYVDKENPEQPKIASEVKKIKSLYQGINSEDSDSTQQITKRISINLLPRIICRDVNNPSIPDQIIWQLSMPIIYNLETTFKQNDETKLYQVINEKTTMYIQHEQEPLHHLQNIFIDIQIKSDSSESLPKGLIMIRTQCEKSNEGQSTFDQFMPMKKLSIISMNEFIAQTKTNTSTNNQ